MALHSPQTQANSVSPASEGIKEVPSKTTAAPRMLPPLLLQLDSRSPPSPPAVWTPDRVYCRTCEDPSPFALDGELLERAGEEDAAHSVFQDGAFEKECAEGPAMDFRHSADASLSEEASVEQTVACAASKSDLNRAKERFQAAVAVVVYMFCSIFAVFWLKFLVADSMPVPLFLSWIQQGVGVCLQLGATWGVQTAVRRSPTPRASLSALQLIFPPVRIRLAGLVQVLPLSFCFVCMIGLSNLCLQLLDVSVYQIARSTTLVFSLVLSALFLGQRHSCTSCCAALVVSLGFGLMTVLERTSARAENDAASPERGFVGLLLGALASFFQALYMVLMKRTIQGLRLSDEAAPRESGPGGYARITTEEEAPDEQPLDGQAKSGPGELEMATLAKAEGVSRGEDAAASESLTAPPSSSECKDAGSAASASDSSRSAEATCMLYNMLNALALFPFAVMLSPEPQTLLRLYGEGHFFLLKTWAQLTALGSVTFVLGASIFWAVSLTSPLSVTFVGYGKTLLQTAFALFVWGEKLSPVGAVGFALTLGGSLWYSVGKMREQSQGAAKD